MNCSAGTGSERRPGSVPTGAASFLSGADAMGGASLGLLPFGRRGAAVLLEVGDWFVGGAFDG